MHYDNQTVRAAAGRSDGPARGVMLWLLACAVLCLFQVHPSQAVSKEISGDLFAALTADSPALDQEISFSEPLPLEPNGSVYGWVWEDLNQNELWDEGEPALEGWAVFVDGNRNGRLDEAEVSTQSDGEGHYSLSDISPGMHELGVVVQEGWLQTWPRRPATRHTVEIVAGEAIKTYFGNTRQLPAPASAIAPATSSISSMRSYAPVEHPLFCCGRLDRIGRSITQSKECSGLPVTHNVDVQVEYVRQHVQGNAFLPMIEMEDGLQFLVHWHF